MHSQYPEIITEITERAQRDQLRHFELTSFMSNINLYNVYQKIDRTMNFFSVYVFEELLEDDFWEDSRYMDKSQVLSALLKYEATNTDIVDCILAAASTESRAVISFDSDMKKLKAVTESL